MPRTSLQECDGIRLKSFIVAGARWLSHYRVYLDQINYFPVPDADTGANMYLTCTAIVNELRKLTSPFSAADVARAAAIGGLMGSKGNSGIILAQFFRGFSEYIGDKNILIADDIAQALRNAADAAYESIMNPREGTILSVARDGAAAAVKAAEATIEIIEVMQAFYDTACASLETTTANLAELKDAGVVDAGGKGLVLFFEGMLRMATGLTLRESGAETRSVTRIEVDSESIRFRFCTSFIIKKQNCVSDDDIRKAIAKFGDSIIVDKGIDNLSKVHIHSNVPDEVLEEAAQFGIIESISIDDMKKQVVDR